MGKGQIERVEDLDVHSVRSARKRDLQTVWDKAYCAFDLSDVYSKEEKTLAEDGFRELFFHQKQQQDLESRNPAMREEKLTEEELLVVFGGLHE